MSEQKVCPTCGTEYPLSERFCPRDGTALRSQSGTADLVGQVVAERYHILKKLGEGGMGSVYLAEHVKMGRKSAIKVMNPGMTSDADAIARFNREAANASRLNHPNICAIYDFGETPDGLIYLAMEFIEGQSLTSLIEAQGALLPGRAGSIIHQTADALQVAHDAGIVHRDLKPDNIMIAKGRDGSDVVKVVDFGIAKASTSEKQNVTRTGLIVGTPEYMSPEQLAADKLDGRSDTYSLGLVAFNCLTGTLPFGGESAQETMIARLTEAPKTLAQVREDVAWPEQLQAVMDRALARDLEVRYPSAAMFGREFAAAVADMPETQAAEGATTVIGAAAVRAAADAKTAAIPKTRVGAPGARPAASIPNTVATPAPVVAKSKLPLFAGGGAVLAAAAVIGWYVTRPDAGGTPGTNGATGATGVAAVTGPSGPTGGTGTATPDTQRLSAPVPNRPNPGTTTARTDPRPSNPTTPTTPSVSDRLAAWQDTLTEVQGVPPRTARRIRDEVATVRAGLSGGQLAEAWYITMLAEAAISPQEPSREMCDAARQVKALHRESSRLDDANRRLDYCP